MKFVLFVLFFVMIPHAVAVDFIMVNRSVNLSYNINYVISISNSINPLIGAQTTFNYDLTALQINWVRQGNFLYSASDDAKVWHVWNNSGNIMAASMIFFDYSITQTAKSTFMTINMKPLKKGIANVNLSRCVLVGIDYNEYSNCSNTNRTIKIT